MVKSKLQQTSSRLCPLLALSPVLLIQAQFLRHQSFKWRLTKFLTRPSLQWMRILTSFKRSLSIHLLCSPRLHLSAMPYLLRYLWRLTKSLLRLKTTATLEIICLIPSIQSLLTSFGITAVRTLMSLLQSVASENHRLTMSKSSHISAKLLQFLIN